MDLKLIKKKLQEGQSKPQKAEKIDYKAIFWKPKPGKHQIRIVPSKFDKNNPFREIYLHYGFAKFPIFALTNWGEADPIVDFSKQLRKSQEKEDWTLASKVSPKARYFIPVLVRGEESSGTRLWEVGKSIYLQLLGIADDEDYGDYTDIINGRDFTVDAVKGQVAGRDAVTCTIRIKPKTSSLTTDETLLERLLNEQPDILEINKRYKHTYETLKEVLQKFLHPEEETPGADATATVADAETEDEEISDDLPWETSEDKTKTNPATKFDKLFDKN